MIIARAPFAFLLCTFLSYHFCWCQHKDTYFISDWDIWRCMRHCVTTRICINPFNVGLDTPVEDWDTVNARTENVYTRCKQGNFSRSVAIPSEILWDILVKQYCMTRLSIFKIIDSQRPFEMLFLHLLITLCLPKALYLNSSPPLVTHICVSESGHHWFR